MPTRRPAKSAAPAPAAPEAQFAALLSRFPAPPEIIALVKKCLPKLRSAVPCTHEIVYEYPHSLVVAFGMSERGYEGIISIAIQPDAFRLYFSKDLPDPKGLLEGTGSKVRFVTIKAASDLDHADIRALFKAAIKHAGVPASKARSPQMLIKSGSKKKTTSKSSKKTTSKK
jgi:hypothetical protein